MIIIEKQESVRYTVRSDQWDETVNRYGEEGAAKFLRANWKLDHIDFDEFGVYTYVTLTKNSVPSLAH